jgi:hypothetical protein
VVVLALALALLAGTAAALLGSSQHIGATYVAWTAGSSDDDHGDLGDALPLLLLLLISLLLPLAVVALLSAPHRRNRRLTSCSSDDRDIGYE